MATFSETVRKLTTFLLAVFLWLHALFFVNVQSTFATRFARYLRLTTSETLLVVLLVIFSFAAGSSFWKTFRSLLYIYAFPFVLFWKAMYWAFLALRSINRWFKAQSDQTPPDAQIIERKDSPTVSALPPTAAPGSPSARERAKALASFLLRPFRRFMFLWCILLLVSTHSQIVWVCLIVVMVHLARRIFVLLKVLFSDPYLKKVIARLFDTVGNAVDGIEAFASDSAPSNELRAMRNQVKTWRTITGFLRDEYLVSRWAWVLGVVAFASIYVYISLLFPFAYFGIAKVSGISYSWGSALVNSLFVPLFATEIPRTLPLRVLAGAQFILTVTIGVGTFFNFLQRRVFAIRTAAKVINDQLIDQAFQEKFAILETKLATSPANPSQEQTLADGKLSDGSKRKKSAR
jgi:hypothetical protein